MVELIKTASAQASQAANEGTKATTARDPFEFNITEENPTDDQIQTICEYVGPTKIPQVVKGANSVAEALRKFKQDQASFQRPVVSCFLNKGLTALGARTSSEVLM